MKVQGLRESAFRGRRSRGPSAEALRRSYLDT